MRLIPARALMLLQARARLADGREIDVIWAPAPADAARALGGGPQDLAGNAAFSFGGAVLAPYANRIRGRLLPDERTIEADISGSAVRLPANGGGKPPGAERYAIHGLILDCPVTGLQTEVTDTQAAASGVIEGGDFGAGWPSATRLEIAWALSRTALTLSVTARNLGSETTPVGLGWHPYFALPSGDRTQARLRLPARARLPVHDYVGVLPTGEVVPVAGTPYDFRAGPALADRYLDDCFVELDRDPGGEVACEIMDPSGGHGVRIATRSPDVTAIQTYAPPGHPFVVVEPQFNWANPFGAEWNGMATGMVHLRPGAAATYEVTVTLFAP